MWLNVYQSANISLAPLLVSDPPSYLRIITNWPITSSVVVEPGEGNHSVQLRVPRWLATPTVAVHQASVGDNPARAFERTISGRRGSYLRIDPLHRQGWARGDQLRFSLSMKLKATRYTGLTTIAGHERYAIEYGPILLALVGAPWNNTIDSMLVTGVLHPDDPSSWLEPCPSGHLHFRYRNATGPLLEYVWKPYYAVDSELFEVYPAFSREAIAQPYKSLL